MAYIGVSPSNGVRTVFDYTATAGQTSFSGSDNNSQTLSYTDSAYIDVYQNGVLLIPSDYTATTGTSVVLDTGATVSDSVQIVVYDVFSVADTVSKANGGTFESNISIGGTLGVTGNATFDTSTLKVDASNNRVGVGTASPSDPLHVTASSGSRIARFEASQANSFIAFKDSNTNVMPTIGCTTDALELKTASSGDPALGLKIDANGHVTKPLQSAFLATPSTNQNDMSNSGNVTVVFGNEVYDQNSDFASNTFTAPVDGKYFLSLSLYLLNVDSAAGYYQITIDTSNRDYFHLFDPNYSADLTYYGVNMGVVADMDANDTAFIRFNQNSGSAQTDINTDARFMGYLLG